MDLRLPTIILQRRIIQRPAIFLELVCNGDLLIRIHIEHTGARPFGKYVLLKK